MPILNKKLFLRLLAGLILLGGGLVVLHHVQAGRVPEALLWQADAALETGRSDKAIAYLRQYLQFRPDDHDTAVRLADMLVDRAASVKDWQSAQTLYERVLREVPQRLDVSRKLVTLCLQMRRYGDALEHAERLLAADKTDGIVHAQVAQCLVAQNRPDEARAAYEQAVTLAPTHVPAFVQYADLLERHFKKATEAGEVLNRLVRTNPERPGAHLALARHLRRVDRPDECLRALDRVFLLDPENGEALVMSAEILQRRGDLPRARAVLRDAIATYPKYAHGYRALSWLEVLGGNQADALATLERGVAALPDAPDLLTPLADLWIERGDLDRAREVAAKLTSLERAVAAEGRKPLALRASYLRGRLLMKEGKWSEALAELEALRTDALGMPGLATQLNLLLAACHERRANREAQLEALRRALALDPMHLGARVALANALLNAGRMEDALKEYQSAAKSPYAGLGVKLSYTTLRLSWARVADGAAEEWKAIGAAVDRLRQDFPETVEPEMLRAEWLAARGDFAEAEKQLREAVTARPGDPRLWSALAGMAARGRGTLAAASVVGEGQLAAGESVELRLARARVWADDPQPGREARLALLEELPVTAGDVERTNLESALAELYAVVGDDVGRTRVLSRLAARDPQDTTVRKALYGLALRRGDAAAQSRWRAELQRAEGGAGRTVAVVDALHEIRRGSVPDRKVADWQDLARAVVGAAPDNPDGHLLLALVAERRRDFTEAVKHLEAAADLDPMSLVVQQARLGYYLRAAQDDAARRTLVRLEADPRFTDQRFRAVIEGAIVLGGPEARAKCLQWLAPHFKREPRSAAWAGRLLEGSGMVSEALGYYRQATETFPAFADGWSARLLASARQGEAALTETTGLAAKALDRPAFFGVCAESGAAIRRHVKAWSPPVGTADDRRAYAEACVSACEARGRLEDALPVLTAIAQDQGVRAADAAWARRTSAALTAALGSPDQKRKAVAALSGSSDSPSGPAEARSRVAALAVALRTATGDERRAIVRELVGLLTTITKDRTATSNDWYQLAQLHAVGGDRAAARQCLHQLTLREPNNQYYLSLVVDDLLTDGRLEEARPLAGRLAEGVQDVRILASAGRFHTLANDPATVLALTERFVRVADPGTADGAARQRQAADVLDQLTRLAASKGLSGANALLVAACERYRASLRAYPEAVAPMASLIALAGQSQTAFDELDRHKARLSPAGLANAGVAVVRTGRASAPQVRVVKGWVESAVAATPDSVPLKLTLGELLALEGNFTAAEPIYRDVLKADGKNLVALNNLAWILASRDTASAEALGLIDRAISIGGANRELLDTRARILIAAGQYDRAVADLADAMGSNGSPLQYFHLALAYSRMGKTADAVKAFRDGRARGLDVRMIHPDDVPAFTVLDTQAR